MLHLGAHYHLSTTLHTITLQTTAGTTLCISLTPLSILHVPCNSEFRLGLCHLLIQDYLKFMNYEDFDVLSAFSQFNRTYPDIPENHVFIVMNH